MQTLYSGRCLCGAIRFAVDAPLAPAVACHCRACQRHCGGLWIAVTAPAAAVEIVRRRLAWVSVSQRARRGFCLDCGGFLFREPFGGETIDIALGAFEPPHDLRLSAHVFVAESALPPPRDGLPAYDGPATTG